MLKKQLKCFNVVNAAIKTLPQHYVHNANYIIFMSLDF